MSRSSSRIVSAVLIAALVALTAPQEARAQSVAANRSTRTASAATRTVWALVGAGIGFGAGMLFGVRRFDDAINSERKVLTSALVGAAIGGVAGATLSRDVKPGFVPKRQPAFDAAATAREFSFRAPAAPKQAKNDDPLWEGMAVGAAVGAVTGLIAVPNRECKPENPECPRILRFVVGIPAIAVGAALGAAVDKLRK